MRKPYPQQQMSPFGGFNNPDELRYRDPDYTYEEEVVDASKTTMDLDEEAYIEFLMQYGHVDFSHINFLPDLHTVK